MYKAIIQNNLRKFNFLYNKLLETKKNAYAL